MAKVRYDVVIMGIPKEVQEIGKVLKNAGYEVYLVGGCVRDLLMAREPKDWDITTNAKPEEIQELFSDSVYENDFGTVGIKTPTPKGVGAPTGSVGVIEVTTFRKEGKYTDKRHPDSITFAKTIEEDLSRRDFTINAMAMALEDGGPMTDDRLQTKDKRPKTGVGQAQRSVKRSDPSSIIHHPSFDIIDPYGGQDDLNKKAIRAVGDPDARFNEDALRLLRAVRFASQLGFEIEDKTAEAVKKHAGLLEMISKERVRDEFSKLIMTPDAADGIRKLLSLGLLRYIVPELVAGAGVGQNKHHIYDVFEHNVRALHYTVQKNYSFEVRLASLLHDVAKPNVKKGEGLNCTFYAHEVVGGKLALRIMDRLRFSKETTEHVAHLVRYHLFYYNVGEVSEAGVRRFIRRVGVEYIDDLLKVREADRIGSGVPKAFPYKLRHLLFMIEKVKRDPISPKALKVDGQDVMRELSIAPGPRIGGILAMLLEEVLENPSKNEKGKLTARMKELNKLSDAELVKLREKAESAQEEFEAGVEEEMKKKHRVQ